MSLPQDVPAITLSQLGDLILDAQVILEGYDRRLAAGELPASPAAPLAMLLAYSAGLPEDQVMLVHTAITGEMSGAQLKATLTRWYLRVMKNGVAAES